MSNLQPSKKMLLFFEAVNSCKEKKKICVKFHFPDEKDLDTTLDTYLTSSLGFLRKLFLLATDAGGLGEE